VEGLVVEAAAVREEEGDPEVERQVARQAVAGPVVLLGDLLDVHQAVPHPEAPLHVVADLVVHPEPAKSSDSPDRTGYPLSPMTPMRVLVLASWEDFAGVGSLDPLLVGTAGGAVATTGRPSVETILLTRWFQLWRKGRNWGPLVVVLPSGSMFVDLVGGWGLAMVIVPVQGRPLLLQWFPQVPPLRSLPWRFSVVVDTAWLR
jgi:hypothetical protein